MTSNDCPSDDLLSRYAAADLSPPVAEALDTHLDRCTVCLARLDELAGRPDTLVAALRRPPPRSAVPPALARVVDGILADPAVRDRPPELTPGAVVCGYRVL